MKNIIKILSFLIFTIVLSSLFAQDISTISKLMEASKVLGLPTNISFDTILVPKEMREVQMKNQLGFSNLLRASEYYIKKDYQNAYLNARNSRIPKNSSFYSLKYCILINSSANIKNIKETAKYYYIAKQLRCILPESMTSINDEIAKSFTKSAFDRALMDYYYFHKRMMILNEIYSQ